MEIRTKTLLIICATLLGLIVVLLALSQSVVLGGFSRVEQQSVQKDTNRVLVALGNDLNTLDAVTTDWASRGDTLSAVRRYPVSVTWDKLDAATFERLQFNYIILYNRSGGFAVGSGYDLTAQHLTPVPEELATLLARDSRMAALGSSPGGGRRGGPAPGRSPHGSDEADHRCTGFRKFGRRAPDGAVYR
jgi:sensor domain CHASE-containing protein